MAAAIPLQNLKTNNRVSNTAVYNNMASFKESKTRFYSIAIGID